MDEEFEVFPLAFKVFSVRFEDGLETVCDFLCDVGGNLLHVAVALEVASADVQRDVRRIDDAVEQGEEVRHDVLHLVGDEDLVAIELNLVAVDVNVVLDTREIEHAGQVEGIVHVEVNPEERLVGHGVEVAIELFVVFVFERRRLFCPERIRVVDDVVLVRVHLFSVFPFRFFAEGDFNGKEAAIFSQQFLNLVLFEELFAVFADVKDDVCATVFFLAVRNFKGG